MALGRYGSLTNLLRNCFLLFLSSSANATLTIFQSLDLDLDHKKRRKTILAVDFIPHVVNGVPRSFVKIDNIGPQFKLKTPVRPDKKMADAINRSRGRDGKPTGSPTDSRADEIS
jgi:hypothetical protein